MQIFRLISDLWLKLQNIECIFLAQSLVGFFFFLAIPKACGSSQAMEQTWVTAVTNNAQSLTSRPPGNSSLVFIAYFRGERNLSAVLWNHVSGLNQHVFRVGKKISMLYTY